MINSLAVYGSTNYCAGLKYAGKVLDDVSGETTSRNKVMIFLSDGDANEALDANGDVTGGDVTTLTNNYITSFKTKYPSCSNYTIAYATETSTLLGNIATSAANQYNYSATSSLAQIFAAIATETSKMQSVSIQDTLSDYVTLPDSIADSDFTVVKTDANGDTTTLTKDTDYTLSYASGSKTVKMILVNPLGLNETVNLSFPVKLTDDAYQQTAESLNTLTQTWDRKPIKLIQWLREQ